LKLAAIITFIVIAR